MCVCVRVCLVKSIKILSSLESALFHRCSEDYVRLLGVQGDHSSFPSVWSALSHGCFQGRYRLTHWTCFLNLTCWSALLLIHSWGCSQNFVKTLWLKPNFLTGCVKWTCSDPPLHTIVWLHGALLLMQFVSLPFKSSASWLVLCTAGG